LKPDDDYAFAQLTLCDLQIRNAQCNAMDAKYKEAIFAGDYCFSTRFYIDAKKKYIEAQSIKPDEIYPKDMIAACDLKINQYSQAAKDSLLPEFIKFADSLVAVKDYAQAMEWYSVANNFSNGKKNVRQKMDHLKFVIDSLDYVQKNPAVEYWQNGQKKIERIGNVNSTFYYKEYAENGNLVREGKFLNEQKSGLWKTYYGDSGKICEKMHYNSGQLDSTYQSWFHNGKISQTGKYKSGMKQGLWKEYSDSGFAVTATNYKNDLRDGTYTEYFSNGKKSLVAVYRNDQLNGKWIEYYANGKMETQKIFVADSQQGIETDYWPNGKKSSQQQYIYGEPNGPERFWDENGNEIFPN